MTLPEGGEYLELFGRGRDVLITCPGPKPELCLPHLADKGRVFILDAPEFSAQMPPSWRAAIPDSWRMVTREQAQALISEVQVVHYTPAGRIFPSLFAPLLARREVFPQPVRSEIWLPGSAAVLIVPEILRAAQILGLRPRLLAPDPDPAGIRRLLQGGPPRLFLSINFRGLDPYGEIQALLEAGGAKVAVWCVDNPFHLLTRQKNRLWQQAALFVTDQWFIEPLTALGAEAHYLPLAVDPEIFAQAETCPAGEDVCFVGRSSFPQRDRFFAAGVVPDMLLREAETLAGRQAHFGWWGEKLGGPPLWPGNEVRSVGLGAERASSAWRTRCLRHLADQAQLTIVGDNDWREHVPAARLLPPVDYYTGLAPIYRQASFSLNLTSLLLPHGLTQRHFDVWACGGFLLTDATPGLALFPRRLTQDIAFETPDQAVHLLRHFVKNPHAKKELRMAWREHILAEHTYVQRLMRILETIGC